VKKKPEAKLMLTQILFFTVIPAEILSGNPWVYHSVKTWMPDRNPSGMTFLRAHQN